MNQPNTSSNQKPVATKQAAKIAIVSSGWHKDIINNALASIKEHFKAQGAADDYLEFYEVPGAFEIPLHAQKLANSGKYEAIITCGFIVNGGIYRHEFVSTAVIDGLMKIQLDTGVPVFSAVLTPRDFHEHSEHIEFFKQNFISKGKEVAQACTQTLAGLQRIAEESQ